MPRNTSIGLHYSFVARESTIIFTRDGSISHARSLLLMGAYETAMQSETALPIFRAHLDRHTPHCIDRIQRESVAPIVMIGKGKTGTGLMKFPDPKACRAAFKMAKRTFARCPAHGFDYAMQLGALAAGLEIRQIHITEHVPADEALA